MSHFTTNARIARTCENYNANRKTKVDHLTQIEIQRLTYYPYNTRIQGDSFFISNHAITRTCGNYDAKREKVVYRVCTTFYYKLTQRVKNTMQTEINSVFDTD